MKYCGFNGCTFNFIEFKSVNFRGCRFKGAHFENVIFENCNLSNTHFQGATFKNVYYTNTSLKSAKGLQNTDLLTRINNHSLKISIGEELRKSLNLCKTNTYIVSSGTLFYREKQHLCNAQKKKEKALSKQERKKLQRERQAKLLEHPKQLLINKVNVQRLLNVYNETEIAKGLSLAAVTIDNEFSSLSSFLP